VTPRLGPGTPGGDLAARPELAPPILADLDPRLRDGLRQVSSVLWAQAGAVDTATTLPAEHLEAFARIGLYGIFAPVADGGLGLGYAEMCAVVEELASACVATTFVWAQHFRFLGAMLEPQTPAALVGAWRAPAVSGRAKGGVALTGLMPGPARLVAERTRRGWCLRGEAPWVSGWDIVDFLVVVARGPQDTVVSVLLEAGPGPGLTATPMRLSALNATRTVRLRFDDVLVADEYLLSQADYALARQQSERLRLNGSFALGVARRCCALLGASSLDDDLLRCREAFDKATEAEMSSARAGASELAVRAAHALAVSRGSASALAGDVAERLSREAALLLVFASRPAIKDALLARLTGS
jgi:alkylation response protein AidB-like acyl-CoA dehydrogenase